MAETEPPAIILPTLRCWRWHAGQAHAAHLQGEVPTVTRCPGLEPDDTSSAEQLTPAG